MPKKETIERFIQAVEEQPHNQVIRKFYTEDASIQENQNAPRIGLENLVTNEEKMLQNALKVYSKCIRPYVHEGDTVVIRWKFRFEWKNGTVSDIEEMTYQQWMGEKIQQEQFFYDPQQFHLKKKEEAGL